VGVKAIYPASFDPVTLGHVDIARRAAAIFDEVIVAVYDTPAKTLLFTTEERLNLLRAAMRGIEHVRVEKYHGLTTDFARAQGARVLIRGLRSVTDFELEMQQAMMYRQLAPEIEIVVLMADLRYTFLSSSLIREVAHLGGDVSDLVPQPVVEALRAKFGDGNAPGPVPRHLNT
jgi:pantetheine-phosphate adenylyltransferase